MVVVVVVLKRMDFLALARVCGDARFKKKAIPSITTKLNYSPDNFSCFLKNHFMDDPVPGLELLPDAWMKFCRKAAYNITEEMVGSSLPWMCAVHYICKSWSSHFGSCSLVCCCLSRIPISYLSFIIMC